MSKGKSRSKHQPLWIAAVSLVLLPIILHAFGLSTNTASMVVILAIATMALNLCVGFTGLVSFGHSTWFGLGAYVAGLIQLHWFKGQIWLPIILSMAFVAVAATIAGILILRRRGVYFSLLTLALAALSYTVAFRWTEVTGGEVPAVERRKARLLVDDRAASEIQDHTAASHQAQPGRIDEPASVVIERHVHRDDVAAREQVVETQRLLDT